MIRILFQGDSITDGNRFKEPDKRWDLNHQIGHSYVYPIAASLGRKFPGKYHFINRGISGDTVDKLAARWQQDTLDEHPDILSILIGTNGNGKYDGIYAEGLEAHLEHFDATYRAILDSAKAQNNSLKLVIMEPFYLPSERQNEDYSRFVTAFARKREIIRRIAEDYGAVFIPLQERIEALAEECASTLLENGCGTDPTKYWLWDGIHPTEPLHGYLAELWLDAAKDLL